MLTLVSLSEPGDQRSILSSFAPESSTWVVSDLRSKLDLNRFLLTERPFIPGDSVLRASELWKSLLTRVRPDLQVVSREFAITLLSDRMARLELDWLQAPGAAQTAYDYLSQLMPILAHPDGSEMMREWFNDHEASRVRWGHWFDLASRLWPGFLEEGFVAPPWIGGVLVNEPALGESWSRPLFVDLGAELNQVEADLLILLSDAVDVTVLRPEPTWAGEYQRTLLSYEIFDRKIKAKKVRAPSPKAPSKRPSLKFRKYTTMIAEVKDATAQTRDWLDAGVEARRVAIVAPDIECYWSALSSYLRQEGIPAQKDHVERLHGFPDIARWLANLRLRTGAFAEADVEIGLFQGTGSYSKIISYERFKTLYSSIYGREDLERSADVAQKFAIDLDVNGEAARDDFVTWTLKQLPEEVEFQRVESIVKRLFTECPQATRLSVRRWLAYFEQLASKVECRVRDGDPNGISCLNISSAENSPATHMIVMGLTESALKRNGSTAILFSDLGSLSQQFGFHLPSDDQARLEFEARWILENSDRDLVLTVPETDFAGAIQAASWLWVRGARERGQHESLSIPRLTRWDELQRSGLERIAQERGWGSSQTDYLDRSFREDLGDVDPEPYGVGLVDRLSPSAIEDYLNCPFVFAAKYLFRLSDVAELDLDVDPSRRGSLMHKVFEILTEEPLRFGYSDEELGQLVETAREKSGLELADARLWPPLKSRYVDLAKRFLDFEREHRRQFPETRTIGRELDIAGYLRPSTGDLVPEKEAGALTFVGKIDRVDGDSRGNTSIMDYKSSVASASQYGAWIKKNQIQLLLYAIAIEQGLTALDRRPVMAALYYVARPLNRDYGFKVTDVDQGLYETNDKRKKNRLTLAERDELFEQGKALVKQAAERIRDGDFAPNPRDRKKCEDCQWSVLCRAPHLSI